MHVVLLHDELSPDARADERDVLVQAGAVSAALHELGHRTSMRGMTLDLEETARHLSQHRPDLVFNLVEAVAGQGRLVHLAPALLDSLRLPYTGAKTEAMFLTSSKTLTKRFLAAHRLPTPTWVECAGSAGRTPPPAGMDFDVSRRWIIKSVWEEASVGLDEDSVVAAASAGELAGHVAQRLEKIGGEGFAEAYIEGREFNLALLADRDAGPGCLVLPPAEMEFRGYGPDQPRVVGYRAKWVEDSWEYRHTTRTFEFGREDAALLDRLRELAARCWTLFGLRGYARVDFRVDAEGRPWILEINANPCLSPDAGFAAAAARAGMAYAEVIRRIMLDV